MLSINIIRKIIRDKCFENNMKMSQVKKKTKKKRAIISTNQT